MKINLLRLLPIVLLFCTASFHSLTAQDHTAEIDALFETWDKKDSPGAALAVMHKGKVVYRKGFGSANLEYDLPITSQTVFHAASLSKQFTAFSILLLVDAGNL